MRTLFLITLLVCGASAEARTLCEGLLTGKTKEMILALPPATTVEAAIASWIKTSMKPIKSVDPVSDTGDLAVFDGLALRSKVFGLGESNHGLHDIPQFRNRLFRYLVEKHNYRVIVPETGIIESRLVERYIQGDSTVNIVDVLSRGITHEMGQWQEMRDLVEWMREYNDRQTESSKKVHFAGADLPVVGDSPAMILGQLKSYLEKVDPQFAEGQLKDLMELAEKASSLSNRFSAAWRKYFELGKTSSPNVDPDFLDAINSISFDQISSAEQARLVREIMNLEKYMAENRYRFVEASSMDAFEWNSHVVTLAKQTMRNLRSRQKYPKIPFANEVVGYLQQGGLAEGLVIKDYGFDTKDVEATKIYFKGRETRERALAENIIWAQRRYGKTMAFAHNLHLMKGSMEVTVGEVEIGDTGARSQGQFLAKHYSKDYSFVMGSMDRYVDEAGNHLSQVHKRPVKPTSSCPSCFENAFTANAKDAPAYFIDFTKADLETRKLLQAPRHHRDQLDFQRFSPTESYDGIVFIKDMRLGKKIKIEQSVTELGKLKPRTSLGLMRRADVLKDWSQADATYKSAQTIGQWLKENPSARESVSEALRSLSHDVVDAVAEAISKPGSYGQPWGMDVLLFRTALNSITHGAAIPALRKMEARNAPEELKALKTQVLRLRLFDVICTSIRDGLLKNGQMEPETYALYQKLVIATHAFYDARVAYAPGILNSLGNLLQGGVENAFKYSVGNDLDNARRDIAKFEEQAKSLAVELELLTALDLALAIAER